MKNLRLTQLDMALLVSEPNFGRQSFCVSEILSRDTNLGIIGI